MKKHFIVKVNDKYQILRKTWTGAYRFVRAVTRINVHGLNITELLRFSTKKRAKKYIKENLEGTDVIGRI